MQVPSYVSWRKKSKNNLLQTVTVVIVAAAAANCKLRPQNLCTCVAVVPGVVIAAMAAVLPKGICNF